MNFSQAFSWQNLLDTSSLPNNTSMIVMAVVFGLLILLGAAVALLVQGEMRKVTSPFVPALLTGGVLGLINLFAWYEGLPGLGTRFFLLLVALVTVVWLSILLALMIRRLPKIRQESETNKRFEKYLPKPKS
ncbi:MAG TPA: hypothetical protein PK263_02240 [bacterium]|nr:hypothetical protein [bacterium]